MIVCFDLNSRSNSPDRPAEAASIVTGRSRDAPIIKSANFGRAYIRYNAGLKTIGISKSNDALSQKVVFCAQLSVNRVAEVFFLTGFIISIDVSASIITSCRLITQCASGDPGSIARSSIHFDSNRKT